MHNSELSQYIATQDGVITREQVLECGLSDDQIHSRTVSGAWRRLFDGIYFDTSHRMSHEARLRAAVFASGKDAVAWGASAGWWHGLLDLPPARPQITVPAVRRVRRLQQCSVRRRDLDPHDVTEVRGLVITALPLTVLDAAGLPQGSVVIDQALQKSVTLEQLVEVHARNGKRVGATHVGRLLAAAADGSRSAAEKLLHRIFRVAGLRGWEAQAMVHGYALDAAFVRERVGIEVDGWRFHKDAKRNSHDLARHNALVNAGWHILRFDWHRLANDAENVVREVRDALALRVGNVS